MGSGGTPIKFGPEWLRNLGEGTNQGRQNNQNNPAVSESSPESAGRGQSNLQSGAPTGSNTQMSAGSSNFWPNNTSRIHLANLRYGREEMLALYDRMVAAPEKLRQFELLYHQRSKPPSALNVSNNSQNAQAAEGATGGQVNVAGPSSFSGRGRGNGAGSVYTKKTNTVRNVTNMGRVWNNARTDPVQGSSVPQGDELRRSWNPNNAAGTSKQGTTEQSGWASTKLLKNRRQIRSTNWRQSGREETDKWRSQEHAARFSNAERDWSERPSHDRSQSWNTNRRPWTEQQNDEIPEWANDNADASAGTFDASGAFHGCNDEARPQEQTLPVTQRYQGGTNRSSSEEAAEQWWASEKAKKLSPKRLVTGLAPSTSTSSLDIESLNNNDQLEVRTTESKSDNDSTVKTFEGILRRDDVAANDGSESNNLSNFQSVMISQNNTLRQKHQNIVTSTTAGTTQTRSSFEVFQEQYEMGKMNIEAAEQAQQGQGQHENMFEGQSSNKNMPVKNPTPNMPCVISVDTSVLPPGYQGGQLQMGAAAAGLEVHSVPSTTKMPNPMQSNVLPIRMPNSASGAALNMQMNGMIMPPIHGLLQINSVFNPGMNMPPMQQHSNMMDAYQQNVRAHIMPPANAPNASVPYLGQNNNAAMGNNHQPNPEMGACMFPPQGLPRHAQPPPVNSGYDGPSSDAQNFLTDFWYYEDPEKKIQGPFSSKEMWYWYMVGYFQPSLIVRRAFETTMRPLAEYGPRPFFKPGIKSQVTGPRAPDTMNPQAGFGLGETSRVWSPVSHNPNATWMDPIMYPESSVNNLPRYFWDVEQSAMSTKNIAPKDMKTEDEILAEILSSQNIQLPRAPSSETIVAPVPLRNVQAININNAFVSPAVPDISQLPVIRPDMVPRYPPPTDLKQIQAIEPTAKQVQVPVEADISKVSHAKTEFKGTKNETDKCKNKDSNGTKSKTKKSKDEKKEDFTTTVSVDEEATNTVRNRSVESSPSQASKDVKVLSKKEQEKEKKELLKDGFTIVKGAEKNNNKDIKKKAEVTKAAEEAARKKRDEEAMVGAEEPKKITLATAIKKQVQQKQAAEFVAKKAPWSGVATQPNDADKGALTLAVIQRLEREKKLEQIKEQQQMMQIIAQQQAAALAREQEVQASLGWSKKKTANTSTALTSFDEIQVKPRRQATATNITSPEEKSQGQPAAAKQVPWGNNTNGGFWDTPSQPPKSDTVESGPSKPIETKMKSKATVPLTVSLKKRNTPAMEFDAWCAQALGFWSSNIDVPTFMVFLKDIESPYEVKDYVKCYLGESKESSDFSRQFLERRSKMLRVGTVTPSDDLCSPALAINPRNNSTSDFQEVKGKGKKTKKNKMMKVDARILGFSVTAAEDRINVGDIDTA